LRKAKGVPQDIKKIFVTAFDVTSYEHLAVQAAFQRYTDNSVSKTINLPSEAKADEVRNIYLTAYKFKCKGITVYRYGSKSEQVLSFGEPVKAASEYSGGCIMGACPF